MINWWFLSEYNCRVKLLRHPYDETPSDLPERTNSVAGSYAKQCLSVAVECGVPAIDLWTIIQQFEGWEAYLRYSIDHRSSGIILMFDQIFTLLLLNSFPIMHRSRFLLFRFGENACSDGLHLSQNGSKVVFEEVIGRLREEGISLETLPFDLPLITEIDPNDPLKSFDNDKSTS